MLRKNIFQMVLWAIFSIGLVFTTIYAEPIILEIKYKKIRVHGKKVKKYTIEAANGSWGVYAVKGQMFDVIVKNKTKVPASIHWHGILLPNDQDGVPEVTQPTAIPPHGEYHYHFPLTQAGTFWMHSHTGLQVQDLMEAPFIITDPKDTPMQSVIIMFQDFSFKKPEEILKKLQSGAMSNMSSMSNMPSMSGMQGMNMQKQDLNDVQYDAYLTNYHTLQRPERVLVKPGSTVRLLFINGAGGSNFWINLGSLVGRAVSFDGTPIQPFTGSKFQLAIGQRIDIIVKIPDTQKAIYPILGQVEGTNHITGIVLQTHGTKFKPLSETATDTLPALNYDQELVMKAQHPLPTRPINQVITVRLNGDMKKYIWTINGQAWPNITPIKLRPNARVELIFINDSNMAHPMHLHGHVFELVGINNREIKNGPLHDTILVLPHTTVKIIFDANAPGKWMLHCHMAFHEESGMMTIVQY